MKTLTIKQLMSILADIPNGQADFKQKIRAYSRPMRRYWRLLANSNNKINKPKEIHRLAFKNEDYKHHQLTTLKAQMREALTDFIELYKLRSSAQGQNIRAALFGQYGHTKKAHKANKTSLQLAPNEAEAKRWLATFEARKAMHLRGKEGDLEKALLALLLFFLVSYLKLTIEQLTLFRLDKDKYPMDEVSRQQIGKVFSLLPAQIPPIIAIQVKDVEYFLAPSFEKFRTFKTVFFNQMDSLDSDRKFLLNSLLNAIVVYPNPSVRIVQEYLPLYQFGIENVLFNEDGVLEIKTVCNILVIAESLDDHELIELAKNKLIPLLADKKERRWCELLAEIYIFSSQKEFDKATKHILMLENSSCFDINFRKQILKIKCLVDSSASFADAYDKIVMARNNFDKFLARNLNNKNMKIATKESCTNFINLLALIYRVHKDKHTKKSLLEELKKFKGNVMQISWLKEKIAAFPLWEYLLELKEDYEKTWNKYETLVRMQKKEAAFRKMLLRYRQKEYIFEKTHESILNFINLLARICDQRDPKNSRRHLLKKLESYGEFMAEKAWIEKIIKRLRP